MKSNVQHLATADVSTAIHVEHLCGYLICLCPVKNSVDDILYVRDSPHGLRLATLEP